MPNARIREKVSRLCLALPETRRTDHDSHSTFCVRKKTLAYYLDNHHDDGVVCLAFSASLTDQAHWLSLDPERYLKPAYIGARGWTSLRLDRGPVDWHEVEARLRDSFVRVAPKTLVKRIQSS